MITMTTMVMNPKKKRMAMKRSEKEKMKPKKNRKKEKVKNQERDQANQAAKALLLDLEDPVIQVQIGLKVAPLENNKEVALENLAEKAPAVLREVPLADLKEAALENLAVKTQENLRANPMMMKVKNSLILPKRRRKTVNKNHKVVTEMVTPWSMNLKEKA